MARSPELGTVLSEQRLRQLVGPVYFERGREYFAHGAVTSVREKQGKVIASVEGTPSYRVQLWADGRGLDLTCTCPLGEEGEACKHVVAAGLAWLAGGRKRRLEPEEESAAVEAFLRAADKDTLVKLILDRAQEDEDLAVWLLVKAQSKGFRSAKAVLRVIEGAFGSLGDYDSARDALAQTERAVDLLEAVLDSRDYAAAVELSERALHLGFAVCEEVGDSDEGLGSTLQRVADIHLRACARASGPKAQLADRLFALAMADPWGIVAVDAYRRALGREGQARFGESVRREWEKLPARTPESRQPDQSSNRYLLTQLMRGIAQETGDVDAMVEVERRDLSHPAAFLRIAELLAQAKRHDEALAWAERGALLFPGGPMQELCDFLVQEYQRRKQFDRALALRWDGFQWHPNLQTYGALRRCAKAAKVWPDWRNRALDLLRAKAAKQPRASSVWATEPSSVLAEIHLAEGDLQTALAQARAGGCTGALWFRLAEACERERPEDAVAIYLERLDPIIEGKNNHAYDEAAELLRKIGKLMRRQKQAARFLDVLAGVQTRHKAKRNLMQRLEPVAGAARKQGAGG
jgi:uncharacterized Zn finger protein